MESILCLKRSPPFFENWHEQVVLSIKSKIVFNSVYFLFSNKISKKKENDINDKSQSKNNFRAEDRFHCTVVILVCGTAILLVGVGTATIHM